MLGGLKRSRINFRGRVQGVGFRYHAQYAANMYGVTGWVKNEFDGSVTMEIQGTEQQISDVIKTLEKGSYIRIDNMDSRDISVVEDERRFRVKY